MRIVCAYICVEQFNKPIGWSSLETLTWIHVSHTAHNSGNQMSRIHSERMGVRRAIHCHLMFAERNFLFYFHFIIIVIIWAASLAGDDATLRHLIRTIMSYVNAMSVFAVCPCRVRPPSADGKRAKDPDDLEVIGHRSLRSHALRIHVPVMRVRRKIKNAITVAVADAEFNIFTFRLRCVCVHVKNGRFAFCCPSDDQRGGAGRKEEKWNSLNFSLLLFCWLLLWPRSFCTFIASAFHCALQKCSGTHSSVVCMRLRHFALQYNVFLHGNVRICAIPARVRN